MIRERVRKCVLREKKGKRLVFFMLAHPLRGWRMEWRGQWDAVIG